MTKKIKHREEREKARLVLRVFEEKKIKGRTEAPTCSGE